MAEEVKSEVKKAKKTGRYVLIGGVIIAGLVIFVLFVLPLLTETGLTLERLIPFPSIRQPIMSFSSAITGILKDLSCRWELKHLLGSLTFDTEFRKCVGGTKIVETTKSYETVFTFTSSVKGNAAADPKIFDDPDKAGVSFDGGVTLVFQNTKDTVTAWIREVSVWGCQDKFCTKVQRIPSSTPTKKTADTIIVYEMDQCTETNKCSFGADINQLPLDSEERKKEVTIRFKFKDKDTLTKFCQEQKYNRNAPLRVDIGISYNYETALPDTKIYVVKSEAEKIESQQESKTLYGPVSVDLATEEQDNRKLVFSRTLSKSVTMQLKASSKNTDVGSVIIDDLEIAQTHDNKIADLRFDFCPIEFKQTGGTVDFGRPNIPKLKAGGDSEKIDCGVRTTSLGEYTLTPVVDYTFEIDKKSHLVIPVYPATGVC